MRLYYNPSSREFEYYVVDRKDKKYFSLTYKRYCVNDNITYKSIILREVKITYLLKIIINNHLPRAKKLCK